MRNSIHFETPENTSLSYQIAGLGTRFVAWVLDSILISIGLFLLLIVLLSLVYIIGNDFGFLSSMVDFGLISIVILTLVFGFVFFAYYAVCEWLMNGQTPGKRSVNIRTVMAGGFSLTFTAIAIRNVFRVLDSIPMLWFIPLISPNSQRFGDMVAGTIVVVEGRSRLGDIQEMLLSRSYSLIRFSFSSAQLESLKEEIYKAILTYFDRRPGLSDEQASQIAQRLTTSITAQLDHPPVSTFTDQEHFLLDLVTAKLRSDLRKLG